MPLALLAGLLLGLSFPKFGNPALAWTALAPLIVAAARTATSHPAPAARLLGLGMVTGSVFFAITLYWLSDVMATFGGLPWALSAFLALLLAGYLAVFPGLFAVVTGLAVRRLGVAAVWLAPCFWVASEWLRAWLGFEFPWGLLGASQATVIPVAQLASVTGVYGLSALVALVSSAAAAIALSRRRSHRLGAAAVAVVLVMVVVGGLFRVAGETLVRSGEVLRVGLVQGNIAQGQKWDPAFRASIIEQYLALSRQVIGAGAQLVLWPEASTPFYLDAEAALAAPLRRLAAESRTPFIVGTDEFEAGRDGEPGRLYNAVVLIGSDGRSRQSYRKMQLVPFGEYVPARRLLFFVESLVDTVSDFSAGSEPVVFDIEGRRVSVAICYESVYPGISRQFVARGSQLLATVTNDAWFGRSSAAYQHFEQGALRAVEQGRFVVRAANTGISGAVDPYGRVVRATPLFESAAITVDVRLLDHRTIYSYVGDVVVWMSLAVTAWVTVGGRRRTWPRGTSS